MKAGAKYEKAKEWNIPVVDVQWLANIASSGHLDAPDGYVPGAPDVHVDVEVEEQPRSSGTGKERSRDTTMDPAASDSGVSLPAEMPLAHEDVGMNSLLQNQSNHQPGPQSSPIGDGDYLAFEPFGQPVGLLDDTASPLERTNSLSKTSSIGPAMSLAELREDMRNTRIPSSASPSPMKSPSNSTSPARISREATKVLQESITSLLGKRISIDDMDAGRPSRPKRLRPPSRTKVICLLYPAPAFH